MARFILGHRLRALGERHGAVEAVLYRLDRAFFGALLWLIRRLPVDTASRLGARIGAALGPRFRKGRALDDNLRLAFPDKSENERRRIAREPGATPARCSPNTPTSTRSPSARTARVSGSRSAATSARSATPPIRGVRDRAPGNWEVSAAAIARQNVPLAVVYSPPTNPCSTNCSTAGARASAARCWRATRACVRCCTRSGKAPRSAS